MSCEAVIRFVNKSEVDPELKEQLGRATGAEDIVRLASDYGFTFNLEELEPVVSLLRFLQDVIQDSELQETLADLPDAEVLDLARRRGYDFSLADLQGVSLSDGSELSEEDLELVSGGVQGLPSRGLRVQIGQPSRRTTDNSFASMLKAGASRTADSVLAGANVAAPFVPGAAVVSAATAGSR